MVDHARWLPSSTGIRTPASCLAQRGFSLLEVMVVLAIVGVVTALAGLSVGTIALKRSGVQQDAQQLVQLFTLAQAQARGRGQSIVWEYDEAGYRFHFVPQTFAPALARIRATSAGAAPKALRARAWRAEAPVRVRVQPAGAQVFDGEWIAPAMTVELRGARSAAVIHRTSDGRYTVEAL